MISIKKIHLVTGLVISVFIGFHLFNHFYSTFSIRQHIELMDSLRLFYRNVIVETILLIAVITQIISGLKLFRRKRKFAISGFEKLHIWTGLYLAIFLVMHISAVFIGRSLLHLDTNFYFGAAGINTFPFSLFFIPYYTLAIFSVFGHIAAVHNSKMKFNFLGLTPTRQAKLILVIGICLIFIIFYGLTNHFKGVAIPSEYDVMIGK